MITLAYLMGCDYTKGIYGVGPITAMEIISQFKGESTLQNFKYVKSGLALD